MTIQPSATNVTANSIISKVNEVVGASNNSLNVDASNLSSTGQKVFDGQWTNSVWRIYNSESVENSTGKTKAISISFANYLPDDGYSYEVELTWWATAQNPTDDNSYTFLSFGCADNIIDNAGSYLYFGYAMKYKNGSTIVNKSALGSKSIVINSSRLFSLTIYNGSKGIFPDLSVTRYKRLGTNS